MCQTVHQVAFGREPILRMKGRNGLVLLLLVLGIAVASYLFWTQWQKTEGMPDGLILANGRLEGDRYTLASKFAGRVEELLAREGDDVHKEQVVVRLDDRQTRAKLTMRCTMYAPTTTDDATTCVHQAHWFSRVAAAERMKSPVTSNVMPSTAYAPPDQAEAAWYRRQTVGRCATKNTIITPTSAMPTPPIRRSFLVWKGYLLQSVVG